MKAVISLSVAKSAKRVRSYRAHVDSLDKLDLMAEFMDKMEASAGKTYYLEEAENVKYLMERLLEVSDEESFRFQLRHSLKVIENVIASLRPSKELISC